MNQRVVAVEVNDRPIDKNLRPTEPGRSRSNGQWDARFAYPGGSRPLEGYTIKRGVGHGGFGEVYFATSDAGKEVALKLIRRNYDVELRGIRHCLNLKHPNLLAIYDIRGDKKDDRWVVMEFVGGQRLDQAIAAHPDGMPVDQVLMWIHGIGAGVAYLHDHGIVHRDLKPGNIFCDEGVVKIGDYGLSKFISCSRRSGQTESVGTVHYMAPEVANGRYGKEIDVYALGVVLYEMLTGRVPFEGESVGEVLMKHLTAAPDVSMLPEPYQSTVARALEKDPAKRFRNVSEMLAALPKAPGPQIHAGPWPSAARRSEAGAVISGSVPCAAPVDDVAAGDEEPILRAARRFCRKARTAWDESSLDSATKIILIGLVLFGLMLTAGLWIWPALALLLLYGCYWVLRKIVLAVFPPPARRRQFFSTDYEPALVDGSPPGGDRSAESAPQQADAHAAQPGHGGRRRHATLPRWARRERPVDALVMKPVRQRITELLGSMLGGALVAATICFMLMVMVHGFGSGVTSPVQLWAWLVLVTTAATWTLLILSKFWEGRRGEAIVRRFILMAAGLAVGAFAAWLAFFLKVRLPYGHEFFPAHVFDLPSGFYAGGKPLAMAYMACFGILFPVIRWWRQADPLRRARLSLFSVVWCVLMACVIGALLEFSQLWLMMSACAMSVSVQLASPWLHSRQRYARTKVE